MRSKLPEIALGVRNNRTLYPVGLQLRVEFPRHRIPADEPEENSDRGENPVVDRAEHDERHHEPDWKGQEGQSARSIWTEFVQLKAGCCELKMMFRQSMKKLKSYVLPMQLT